MYSISRQPTIVLGLFNFITSDKNRINCIFVNIIPPRNGYTSQSYVVWVLEELFWYNVIKIFVEKSAILAYTSHFNVYGNSNKR